MRSRLKSSPAGVCCEPELRGPSWLQAEWMRPGSGASVWAGSPSACAAPHVSEADPLSRSH